jgi:hypothetical protein
MWNPSRRNPEINDKLAITAVNISRAASFRLPLAKEATAFLHPHTVGPFYPT